MLDEFPRLVVRDIDRVATVASLALGRIGTPSIAPILDLADDATDEQWQMLVYSLRTIEDQAAVLAAIEQLLDAGVGPLAQSRLEEYVLDN